MKKTEFKKWLSGLKEGDFVKLVKKNGYTEILPAHKITKDKISVRRCDPYFSSKTGKPLGGYYKQYYIEKPSIKECQEERFKCLGREVDLNFTKLFWYNELTVSFLNKINKIFKAEIKRLQKKGKNNA